MKIPIYKPMLVAGMAAVLASCGSSAPAIVSTPIENIDEAPLKVSELTEVQLKGWGGADLVSDTIPGMSVQKAYNQIIKNNKGKKVIVAVIDSGVDIEHEDLDGVIWTNRDEKPNNNRDDDNNGYVDDMHGWNFLGDAVEENLEYTRIYKKLKPKYSSIPAGAVKPENREEFELYQRAKAEYDKEYNEVLGMKNQYEGIVQQLNVAHNAVSTELGKEDYTLEELKDMSASTEEMQQYKGFLSQVMTNVEGTIPEAMVKLQEAIEYFDGRLSSHFNLDLDGRAVVGDDVDDITDTDYGNANVMGPTPDKEDIKHGTHVAGIIAAERGNNTGIDGVANNVEIMVLRAVPDGDEYDKDIALAIRYAVDNGASIINTSFGKYFSTHPEWVRDAIKYADKNDVLIVNAAGNEGLNLDTTAVYPNDQDPENTGEISDNFLTVGALNYQYGSGLVAGFSNYGKTNVDVFAPGTKIWSTTPNNEYEYLQGTSMAAPAVAGVAAMIRSYFPNLSDDQVKQVIMNSGLTSSATVIIGGDPSNTRKFSELSTSGKMVNLYNAMILADKMSK
ncbi:S8 family serine peptidase [Salinimicrobium sediminilitoris]|uniref:S8 family serine peptidase n=1 Tax=Salinimicrobium sediminilitoris TaxID=2876715 RepID=UPI001E36A7B0|nr:S8 family serine peptidase [Salinimicrobium sediminilitoris]MCC8359517.1 S8 family serine peptidase [Salinimicrobium sediminilitoris]